MGGLLWLSVGALLSLVLEVVYLGAYIPMPNGMRIAFPITILIAWWFTRVLTKTARLWTPNPHRGDTAHRVGLGFFAFFGCRNNNW